MHNSFWHCVIVDALITIELLEKVEAKWPQMLDAECFISDLLLLFMWTEEAHAQHVYPNLHFKMNLKNNCAFHFNLIFHSIIFCAGSSAQTVILSSGYLPERAEWSTCRELRNLLKELIFSFIFHFIVGFWGVLLYCSPQPMKKYSKRHNYAP